MKHKRTGLFVLLAMYLIALGICLTSRVSYSDQDRDALLEGSSLRHVAGTDGLGRDRAVRISAALLLSLTGSGIAALASTSIAGLLGVGAAFLERRMSAVLIFVLDVFLALPWLFLLMIVRAAMPLNTPGWRSTGLTFLLLAALGWPVCARAVHKSASSLRDSEWLIQARASGLRSQQLISYTIPNLAPILVTQFIVSVPAFVMAEANLGSIGLGIAEPIPSWGGMLQELANSSVVMQGYWAVVPVLILACAILVLESIGTEEASDV